jgi:hypothetical protein
MYPAYGEDKALRILRMGSALLRHQVPTTKSALPLILVVKAWFEKDHYQDWLLILDGLNSPDQIDIAQLIPSAPHGQVLITIRLQYALRQALGRSAITIESLITTPI